MQILEFPEQKLGLFIKIKSSHVVSRVRTKLNLRNPKSFMKKIGRKNGGNEACSSKFPTIMICFIWAFGMS